MNRIVSLSLDLVVAVVGLYVAQLNRYLALRREYVIHAETPAGELNQVVMEGLEGYFRSHPEPSERLAQIRKVIADDHLMTKPLTPLSDKPRHATALRP